MGRGAKPLYSLHRGRRLGYVQSRIEVYAPLYAWCVETYCAEVLDELRQRFLEGENIALFDFDGYCHHLAGMDLKVSPLIDPFGVWVRACMTGAAH